MSKTLEYIVSRLGDAAGWSEVSTSLLYDAKREVDACITELTTKVADLKAKLDFANAMNADQYKTVGELNAEVEQMTSWIVWHGTRVTNHACAECLPDGEILIHGFRCGWHTAIARNALKEG